MPTMAQAIKSYVQQVGKATADQIKKHVASTYPDQWKASTLQAHLYACVVNNPKAYIHHPSAEKFLYKHANGAFELYSEALHGPNEWTPSEGTDDVAVAEEIIETAISLERDIEDHLVEHLDRVEKGLEYVGRQISTDVGRIDILAKDSQGEKVIIEVKAGPAKDSAVGQIARYLGYYAKMDKNPPRAILIAGEFPDGVKYAASAIPRLKLLAYRVSFSFDKQDLTS